MPWVQPLSMHGMGEVNRMRFYSIMLIMYSPTHSLEDIFDWLGNRGVVLDQTLYTTLAYNIDYSKSRSARVKRSAILTLHRSMKQRRVLPDQAFFTAAFQSVMAANDHKSCALLLVSMKNAGVRLAQPLDAVLVVFLLRCGQIDMAEQVDEAVNSHSDELVQARYYAYLRARIDRFVSSCLASCLFVFMFGFLFGFLFVFLFVLWLVPWF